MDPLEVFLIVLKAAVELLGVTAWPAVAAFFLWHFREQLGELLKGIKRAKFGSAELEFETAAPVLAKSLETLDPAPAMVAEAVGTAVGTSEALGVSAIPAEGSAREQIVMAYVAVEDAVRLLAKQSNFKAQLTTRRTTREVLAELVRMGKLEGFILKSFDELRRLRNLAVHSEPFLPSDEAVQDFKLAAGVIVRAMNKLIRPEGES